MLSGLQCVVVELRVVWSYYVVLDVSFIRFAMAVLEVTKVNKIEAIQLSFKIIYRDGALAVTNRLGACI